MIDIKELRRLVQAATPGPWKLLPVGDKSKCFAVADINFLSVLTVVDECGTSFGAVYLDGDAKFIAAANPATVSELLDRLEAAESDALEQARLNGMGASREAALMAKLEAAEKDIALKERVIDSLGSELNAAANERDALRTELADLRSSMTFRTSLIGRIEAERDALQAKVEAMERQKPVTAQSALAEAIIADMQAQHDSELITENDSGEALIRLDGAIAAVEDNFALAQPASSMASSDVSLMDEGKTEGTPSVPEDVMRDAERYRYLRARDCGTAGDGCWLEADGRACDRGWLYGDQLDSAIDTCIEMPASAPEAKP
jgi:hypothetical protein